MSDQTEVKDLNPYQLSDMANCGDPDDRESPGAKFLIDVRDAVLECWDHHNGDANVSRDCLHEIADNAPDVYTHGRWQEFVDLSAHQEEPEITDAWPSDLTEAAGVALYQIADRLAHALVNQLDEAATAAAEEAQERYADQG